MASENKSADLKQIQRPTQRGLKKCTGCGAVNGSRALLCRNPKCLQHKNVLDGVQLVCRRAGCAVYSIRSKEQGRDTQARNFVCIEDVTLSLQPNAAVVSSKAICYVDACKSDNDCRHIKACREGHDQMPKALVYTVSREVLWNLNIGLEQKQQLWQQYKSAEEQEQLPAVQRLSPSTFVVKCQRSDTFPAAHLHVTALANGVSTKKANYACACRKLKIIVEPDNSLVMQDEICDHLLLVLAGILSSPQGKTIYGNFTKSLQSFWMPERLETPLGEATHDDLRLSLNINMGGDADPPEDIYIFGDEFCVTDSDLLPLPEELSDLIYDVDIDSTPALSSRSSSAVVRCANDAQLLSNYDIYAEEEQEQHDQHLELTDCNIELMDQYQLTDQIDLCSEDIELPLVSEPYNILAPLAAVTSQLPAIELPTIAVVKKPALKASEIVDEVKTRKQPPLPAKRALIVNEPAAAVAEAVGVAVEPALAYAAWLDYVIELLNESIEPATEPGQAVSVRQVLQEFHVHKETFSHFSKSFSAGIKRRPLHQVSVIEAGKHKGLTKYVWQFSASHTVKRIFTSRNLSLQLERCFEQNLDGQFVAYVRQAKMPSSTQTKQRQVHTRLRLYMANMLFDAEHKVKSGLFISWIPDVLPRSNFGLMDVEFTLQTRAPI